MARDKTYSTIRRKAAQEVWVLRVADVAKRYRVTPPTIRAWAKEFGVPLPKPVRPKKIRRRTTPRTLLIRCMVSLFGVTEAARQLGISKQYVYRVSKGVSRSETDFIIQLFALVCRLV